MTSASVTLERVSANAARPTRVAMQRRAMWFGLAAALLLLPLLSDSGKYVADSRDAVWMDPWGYLRQAFWLWQPSPYLGHVQVDGIIFPMGTSVGLLRLVGLPVWVAERVWHGLLLLTAAGGTILFVDRIRGRISVLVPLVAGLLYALTPYTFGYGLPTSGVFLPYVLLPMLLLVTVWALERELLAGAAAFGLVTFAMGGGNGAPQTYVIFTAVALGAWMAFAERSVTPVRAAKFFGLAAAFTLALNAYWLIPLAGSEASNILAFSEQPKVINVASSFSETLRGLGLWLYYGGDQFGPWVTTVRHFFTSLPFVFASFLVPVAALLAAWLGRWRFRLFFLFLLIFSVMLMAGTFPVTSPTPFGRFLLFLYGHAPVTAGLRTTYKFGGALNLSLAVLAAMGLDAALEWQRTARIVRVGLAAAVGLTLVVAAFPMLTGSMYRGSRETADLPGYWRAALADLDKRNVSTRAFFAPSGAGLYRWGGFHEGIAEATPSLPSVHPVSLPIGARYGSNLIAAIENIYQQDVASENVATVFRYLGVRDVVLQNDLDWQRAHTARPAELQTLTGDPSLSPLTSFGPNGRNVTAKEPDDAPDAAITTFEKSLPPVQILTVPRPKQIVHIDAGQPVVISGDGFGLASAASDSLLAGQPPVLYSGDLTPDALEELVKGGAQFIVTDSNRRRVWSFTGLRGTFSYTLPADEDLNSPVIGWGLFGERIDTQTVAEYTGVRSISASGYGSALSPQPENRPANAFDGDTETSWLVGGFDNPIGQWVQVVPGAPVKLDSITFATPDLGFGRRVNAVRIEFSDGTSVLAPIDQETTTVEFPARTTSYIRVRITSTESGLVNDNPVGFSEIEIPGVTAREVLRMPSDLLDTARRTKAGLGLLANSPISYVFDRARTDALLGADEERGIAREFQVPAFGSFTLTGSGHLDQSATDDKVDLAVRGPSPVQVMTSGRLFDAFNVRGSMAFDGLEKTAWLPRGDVGQWLEMEFPTRTIDRVSLLTQTSPDRLHVSGVRLTFSDGTSVDSPVNSITGRQVVTFPPHATSSVRITITSVVNTGTSAPVGIAEVKIPGVELAPVSGSQRLPCLADSSFSLDGRPMSVRLDGTVAEALAGKDLPVVACTGAVPLSAGTHRLFARGVTQPDRLVMERVIPAPPAPSPAPRMRYVTDPDGSARVRVFGADRPFYLVIGQNWSPRWVASIGGESLGPPMVVDGYSAGWRIDRRGSFVVDIHSSGQSRYRVALLLTVLGLLAAVITIVVVMMRRRRA